MQLLSLTWSWNVVCTDSRRHSSITKLNMSKFGSWPLSPTSFTSIRLMRLLCSSKLTAAWMGPLLPISTPGSITASKYVMAWFKTSNRWEVVFVKLPLFSLCEKRCTGSNHYWKCLFNFQSYWKALHKGFSHIFAVADYLCVSSLSNKECVSWISNNKIAVHFKSKCYFSLVIAECWDKMLHRQLKASAGT